MRVPAIAAYCFPLLAACIGPAFSQEHLGPDEMDREARERHERFHEQTPGADCSVREGSPIDRITGEVPDLRYNHKASLVPASPAPVAGMLDGMPGTLGELARGLRDRINTSGFPEGYGGIERIPGVERVLGRDFNIIGGYKDGGMFIGGGYRREFDGNSKRK